MTSKYKIEKGSYIYGFGYPIIISTLTETPNPNLRIAERFKIVVSDVSQVRLCSTQDNYTLPITAFSNDDIVKTSFDLAKAELEISLFESKEQIKDKGFILPYNAQFIYEEMSPAAFIVFLIRNNLNEMRNQIVQNTKCAKLTNDFSSIQISPDWNINSTETIKKT